MPAFAERNVTVMAASVDSQEDAQELVEMLGLTFPVGYGLDHMEFATQTGAFYEVCRSIIHATEFMLKPDGALIGAVYSVNPIGRYRASDCLRMIDFLNR